MARESTEIKTINDTRGSRTTNNFSIVGTSNEIDVATSAGTGNNPGTVQIGISSNFSGGGGGSSAGTADFLIMEANTGAVNHSNDAGSLYNVNTTSYQFICFKNEQTKDAIYTHSTSSSSEEVTVTEAGTYMIFYAVRTDNLDDNRFVTEAAIHHQPSGGSYAERDYTRATSYSRGSGGSGVYDFDIQLNFAGALVLGAGDKIKLGVKQNDADDSGQTVRVQTDGTMLTMCRVAAVGNKANIIAATGSTTLTNAQSGSVVYVTGSGSVTLPSSMATGVQFVIINDTGSNETIGENGNTHILGTHAAMPTNTARTYIAVSDGNFAAIG
jgi:hypothetical protein